MFTIRCDTVTFIHLADRGLVSICMIQQQSFIEHLVFTVPGIGVQQPPKRA